jgi:hypothetical protein
MHLDVTCQKHITYFHLPLQKIGSLIGIVNAGIDNLQRLPVCSVEVFIVEVLKLPDELQ